MQKTMPLVSICIPTYNRLSYLKKCVQSIVSQPEFQNGKVEIAISDNVSTDGTKEWCEEQVEKYRKQGNFIYHRNDYNTGFVNGILALCRGTGKLRKLSEDTIIYNHNSMKFFCNAVEKYDEDRPLLFFANHVLPSSKGVLDFYSLIYHVSIYTTWFAAFSVWDTDIDEIYRNKDKFDEKIPSTEIICKIMSRRNKGIVLGDEFGKIQLVAKKNISYGLYETFHDRQLSILTRYIPESHEKKNLLEYIEKCILYRQLAHLLIFHITSKNSFIWDDNFKLMAQIEQQYQHKEYYSDVLNIISEAKQKYTQSCKNIKQIVAEKCAAETDIIIYGAGSCGDVLFQVFLDTGIQPTAYCVTDDNYRTTTKHNNLPVKILSDLKSTNNKNMYFVAGYKPLNDIFIDNLEKNAIKNYIDVSDSIDFNPFFAKLHNMM